MSSYFNQLFNNKNSGLGFTKNNTGGINTAVIGAVSRFKTYLSGSIGKSDVLCQFFSTLWNPSDQIIDSGKILAENFDDYVADVTSSASVIDDAVLTLHDSFPNGVALTDQKGRAYNLIFHPSDSPVINGKQILIATTNNVRSIQDALIYKDGSNKYYMNEIVFSADWVEDADDSHNIMGRLEDVIAYLDLNPENNDLQSYVNAIVEYYDMLPSITIWDTLEELCREYFGYECSNIVDAVDYLYSYLILPNYHKGQINTIYDIMRDEVESSEINAALHDMSLAIMSNSISEQTFSYLRESTAGQKYDSLRTAINFVRSGWLTGGVYGAASALLNYAKTASNVVNNGDGTMSFTDNSVHVPGQYIAGFVNTLVNAISSVVSLVATVLKGVLGIAFALIGSVFSAIGRAISYDASATRCGVIEDTKAYINASPLATLQFDSADLPGGYLTQLDYIVNQIESAGTAIAISIPGGYFWVGPSGFDSNNHVTGLRFEFHASTDDHVSDVISYIHNNPTLFNVELYGEFNSIREYTQFGFTANSVLSYGKKVFLDVVDIWSTDPTPHAWENSSDDGDDGAFKRLTAEDDAAMQEIICCNTFIAWLYILSLIRMDTIGGDDDTDYASVHPVATTDILEKGLAPWGTGSDFDTCDIITSIMMFCPCADKSNLENGPSNIWGEGDVAPLMKLGWSAIVNQYIYNNSIHGSQRFENHYPYWGIIQLVIKAKYFDNLQSISNNYMYYLMLPKYDASTFYSWIIASVVILSAATLIGTFAFMKIRKFVQNKRIESTARVEKTYEDYKNNPTKENLAAYRKAIKSSRRNSLIFGGTKFSYDGYWSTDQTSAGSTAGVVSSVFSILNDHTESGKENFSMYNAEGEYVPTDPDTMYIVNQLYLLITGHTKDVA